MTAREVNDKYARIVGLDEGLQVVALAGYLTQEFPGIDPEAFTDSFADLLQKAGLPTSILIDFFCFVLDRYGKAAALDAYLSVFVTQYRKYTTQPPPPPPPPPSTPKTLATPEPPPPPPTPIPEPEPPTPGSNGKAVAVATDPGVIRAAMHVPASQLDEVRRLLSLEAPASELGTRSFYQFRLDLAGRPAGVDRVVADLVDDRDGPWLDIYLMGGGHVVASGPPCRSLDSPVHMRYGGVKFEAILTPGD